MKKLLIASVFAVVSTLVMADSAFDGVNTQIGIGFASIGNSTNDANGAFNSQTSQTGLLGSVAAGYSYGLGEKFNLEANIFYNFGASQAGSSSVANGYLTNQSNVKNLWGISVEPGYYFTDRTLGSIKLGWATASTNQTLSEGGASANINTGTANGFLYGLGLKQMLADNVYLGVDVYQVTFGTTSTSVNGVTISSKPNYTFGGLNIGYKF